MLKSNRKKFDELPLLNSFIPEKQLLALPAATETPGYLIRWHYDQTADKDSLSIMLP